MTWFNIASSLVLGFFTGCMYGFLLTRKTAPPIQSHFVSSFFMGFVRIGLVALMWNYILRRTSLSIILVLVSFLASFWTIVIKKKVQHERL